MTTTGERDRALSTLNLPALNALGDLHFPLARQQGNRAHLAQVHAHRVVGLVEGAGGQVEIDVFPALFGLRLVHLVEGRLLGGFGARGFQDFDAGVVEHGEQVVEVLGGMHVGGQKLVDLVIKQITLLLPHAYKLVKLIKLLVKGQWIGPPG